MKRNPEAWRDIINRLDSVYVDDTSVESFAYFCENVHHEGKRDGRNQAVAIIEKLIATYPRIGALSHADKMFDAGATGALKSACRLIEENGT